MEVANELAVHLKVMAMPPTEICNEPQIISILPDVSNRYVPTLQD